jgi:hypothetical protein
LDLYGNFRSTLAAVARGAALARLPGDADVAARGQESIRLPRTGAAVPALLLVQAEPFGQRNATARGRAPDGAYIAAPYGDPHAQNSAAYADYNFGGGEPMQIDRDSLPWIGGNIQRRLQRSGIVLSPGPSAIEFLQLQPHVDDRLVMGEFAQSHRDYQLVTFSAPRPDHPIWGKFQPLTGGALNGHPQPEIRYLDLWNPPPELDGMFELGACYSAICSIPPDEEGFDTLQLHAMRPIAGRGVMALQLMAKSPVWDDKGGNLYRAANVRYFRILEGAVLIDRHASHKLVLSEQAENHEPYEGLAALVLQKPLDFSEEEVALRMAELRLRPEALRVDGVPLLPRHFVQQIARYEADAVIPLDWAGPSGDLLLLRQGSNGSFQLYLAGLVEEPEPRTALRQLTDFDDGVTDARFVPDGSGRVLMRDERGHVLLLDAREEKYFDLTHGPGLRDIGAISPAGDKVLVTTRLTDGSRFDIIDLNTPAERKSFYMGAGDWIQDSRHGNGLAPCHRGGMGARSHAWTNDGNSIIAIERAAGDPRQAQVWRVDAETGAKTLLLAQADGAPVSYDNLAVTPGDEGFYFTTSRDADRLRLAYFDFASSSVRYLEPPEDAQRRRGDVESFQLSPDGRSIAAVTRVHDPEHGSRSILQLFDLQAQTVTTLADRLAANASAVCWHADSRHLTYAEIDAEYGSTIRVADTAQPEAVAEPWLQTNSLPTHPRAEHVSWTGAAGQPMSGWLYRPPADRRPQSIGSDKFTGPRPVYVDMGPGGAENLGGLRYLVDQAAVAVLKIDPPADRDGFAANAAGELAAVKRFLQADDRLDAGRLIAAGEYGLDWALADGQVAGGILHADRATLERWLADVDGALQSAAPTGPVMIFASADDLELAHRLVQELRKRGVETSYVDAAYEPNGRFVHARNARYADVLIGAFVDQLPIRAMPEQRARTPFGQPGETDAFAIIAADESEGISFGSAVHGMPSHGASAPTPVPAGPAPAVYSSRLAFGESTTRDPDAAIDPREPACRYPFVPDFSSNVAMRTLDPEDTGFPNTVHYVRQGIELDVACRPAYGETTADRRTAYVYLGVVPETATVVLRNLFPGRFSWERACELLALSLQHTYFETFEIGNLSETDDLELSMQQGWIATSQVQDLIERALCQARGIPASAISLGERSISDFSAFRYNQLVHIEPWAARGLLHP